MGKNSLYFNVYYTLKREITDGILTPGTFLPTEHELEERFSVSRTTIRKAVGLLSDEGYLEVKQGRGTKVLDTTTTQNLSQISSITETLIQQGHDVTISSMSIEKIEVSDSLNESSGFEKGMIVYKVERILCSDGVKIVYFTNYLRADMLPGFEQYCNQFVGLYSFLEKKYNIVMTEATETLSAAGANFVEAQILDIPFGTPLLISKRITYVDDVIFEYGVMRIVGDKYKYSIHLRGR